MTLVLCGTFDTTESVMKPCTHSGKTLDKHVENKINSKPSVTSSSAEDEHSGEFKVERREYNKCATNKISLNFGIESILSVNNDIESSKRHAVHVARLCDTEGTHHVLDTSISSNNENEERLSHVDDIEIMSGGEEDEQCEYDDSEFDKPTSHMTDLNTTGIRRDILGRLNKEVSPSLESYIHFPLAFHALSSSGLSLSNQQTLFPGAPWSSSLINDIRKERLSGEYCLC